MSSSPTRPGVSRGGAAAAAGALLLLLAAGVTPRLLLTDDEDADVRLDAAAVDGAAEPRLLAEDARVVMGGSGSTSPRRFTFTSARRLATSARRLLAVTWERSSCRVARSWWRSRSAGVTLGLPDDGKLLASRTERDATTELWNRTRK